MFASYFSEHSGIRGRNDHVIERYSFKKEVNFTVESPISPQIVNEYIIKLGLRFILGCK